MIRIAGSAYDSLRRHGESTYPEECCGVLIGHIAPEGKRIFEAIPVENAADSKRNRYQIAPLDIIRVEREARAAGLEIVGFYHSHPDHPAHWSPTDLEEAHWLGCSYIITAVLQGETAATRSFSLAGSGEDDKRFEPEEICLDPQPF